MAATAASIGPDDERFRTPGAETQWSDSFYFGGGDPRGTVFYTRIGRRPNEGRIEAALGLWLPDGRFVLVFSRAQDREGDAVAAGPLRYTCEQPFALWTVDVDGAGAAFPRAEALAGGRDAATPVAVRGRLRFMAWDDPISIGLAGVRGVADRHYEQAGSVAGVLEVDGVRLPLAGAGLRDHSWGVRDWQGVPWWRWFGMVVDPDTYLLANEIGTPGGEAAAGGWMQRDGEGAPVVACTSATEYDPDLGCQRRFTVRVRDALGREARLDGEAVAVAPLRQRRDGRLTHVNEGLTRLRWDGHEGLGVSEYLIQSEETDA
ncbi:MAG: hypothetical protein U0R70_01810 [Solirubrobacteraceae bacterium]